MSNSSWSEISAALIDVRQKISDLLITATETDLKNMRRQLINNGLHPSDESYLPLPPPVHQHRLFVLSCVNEHLKRLKEEKRSRKR